MWFLEIVESVLLAVPWIGAVIIGAIGAVYAFTIGGWAVVVLADVLGYDLCSPARISSPPVVGTPTNSSSPRR